MGASQKPMTLEAFLDWEERQPLRYEFDGVHVHAMTGDPSIMVASNATF